MESPIFGSIVPIWLQALNPKVLLRSKILTYLIALVWLLNGLFAKVLNLVPRHTEIVANILGEEYARPLTVLIGCSEIAMAVWIWLDWHRKPTAIIQIAIILIMNTLESLLVPALLLWGYFNPVFAVLFCGLIRYHGFRVKELYGPA